jgi:sulfite reductase alpha subunit
MAKHKTPLLDQLESGPWPSFVSDLKQEAARANRMKKCEYQIPVGRGRGPAGRHGALLQTRPDPLETRRHRRCFRLRRRRYRSVLRPARCVPRRGPFSHHARQPAGGKFYTTEFLKKLCDLWEFRGSGITNMHGSTGDIIFLGTTTPSWKRFSMK